MKQTRRHTRPGGASHSRPPGRLYGPLITGAAGGIDRCLRSTLK